MRQINQPLRLLLLLPLNLLQPVSRLKVLNQHVAVNPQEYGEERLDGFEVAACGEAAEERGGEGVEVREGGEGADFEVDVRGGEGFEVLEEGLVCVGGGETTLATREEGREEERIETHKSHPAQPSSF